MYGTCYLGSVFPKIYHVEHFDHPVWEEKSRQKRGLSAGEIVGGIFGAIMPNVGVILNNIKIRKLSSVVDRLSTNTAGALLLVNTEMAAIRAMVLQNWLALDILLAKESVEC